MDCILFSTAGDWVDAAGITRTTQEEVAEVNKFFDHGLKLFHLRKPMYSVGQLREWLSFVNPKYMDRIALHTFHDLVYDFPVGGVHSSERQRKKCSQSREQDQFLLEQFPHLRLTSSFHDLGELRFAPKVYSYVFISPVYDSISRPHYRARFSEAELESNVQQARNRVIALGGVTARRIPELFQMGFQGVGLLGTVWQSPEPLKSFIECRDICEAIAESHCDIELPSSYAV